MSWHFQLIFQLSLINRNYHQIITMYIKQYFCIIIVCIILTQYLTEKEYLPQEYSFSYQLEFFADTIYNTLSIISNNIIYVLNNIIAMISMLISTFFAFVVIPFTQIMKFLIYTIFSFCHDIVHAAYSICYQVLRIFISPFILIVNPFDKIIFKNLLYLSYDKCGNIVFTGYVIITTCISLGFSILVGILMMYETKSKNIFSMSLIVFIFSFFVLFLVFIIMWVVLPIRRCNM